MYNDNNDLTSYTDTAGNKTTLTYDSNRNLLRTKSAKGVVYANGYNSNGTLNANETRNADTTADSTMVIRTNQTYFTDNTSTTVKENAFTNIVYNEDNKAAATYTYDFNSGAIKTVKDAKGTVTTNSYNSNYTRLNSVTTDNTSVKYSYTGDRMNKITFSGIDGKNESYGFTFDNFGNVTTTKVGNQILVTNEYEERNGLLGKETYGNNDKKATKYNNLGLIKAIETKDADSSDTNAKRSYEWTYSSVGVALSHTDNENNLRYIYDYDSLGRLIRQEVQDNTSFNHVGSTEVTYDVRNNVTKVESEFGGNTAVDQYLYSASSGATNASSYTKDNLVSRYKINGLSSRYIDYTYDEINRLTNKKLQLNGKALNSSYTFKTSDRGTKYTTSLIETEKLDNTTYKYYYDKVGNITKIDKGSGAYRSYTYDKKNQLLSEVNSTNGITTAFTYDSLGNITKKVESGNSTKTISYRYGNDGKSGWNNLLTGVDLSGNATYESNETISYDAIGNPTTYLGASLSWYGRQLKSYTKGSTSVSYTYDSDGLRGTKIYNGTKSTYHYVGGQLRYETRGNLKFYYFYDAYGNLSAIRYHNASGTASMYYVLTNIHGDVLDIYSGSGDLIASYEYDAWGKVVSVKDANNEDITSTSHIANLNPIRYRGYYYDTETGLYYLQSRYYDPQAGRFLNADDQLNQNTGVLGFNTFAYAQNNPLKYSDPFGHSIILSCIIIGSIVGTITGGTIGAYVSKKKTGKVSCAAVATGALCGGVVGGLIGWGVGVAITAFGAAATGTATTVAAPLVDQAVQQTTTALQTYYPPNGGFYGTIQQVTLQAGTLIQRTGELVGRYVAPAGTPTQMLSLPYDKIGQPTTILQVQQAIQVTAGRVAPWFGQIGGGIQYQLGTSLDELISEGVIKILGG